MAARASVTTKEYLSSVPLPTYQGKYTVISHQHIIDTTMKLLGDQGLVVDKELYKCSKDGDIAIGRYHIIDTQDPEMGMMFAWGNSYNKQMKFKCAIGAHLFVCDNGMIAGDLASYGRKHMGGALQECTDTIEYQIVNANNYYTQLISDKKNMKDVMVPERVRAELLGRLLFEHKALTLNQVGEISHEIEKPSFDYNADKDSLWTMYNHITLSLKKSHPKFWMDQQRQIHWFLCSEFGIGAYATPGINGTTFKVKLSATMFNNSNVITPIPVKDAFDPNQITIDQVIREVELEQVPVPELEGVMRSIDMDDDPTMPGLTKVFVEHTMETVKDIDIENLNQAIASMVVKELSEEFNKGAIEIIPIMEDTSEENDLSLEQVQEMEKEPVVRKSSILSPEEQEADRIDKEENGLTKEQLDQIAANIEAAQAEKNASKPNESQIDFNL